MDLEGQRVRQKMSFVLKFISWSIVSTLSQVPPKISLDVGGWICITSCIWKASPSSIESETCSGQEFSDAQMERQRSQTHRQSRPFSPLLSWPNMLSLPFPHPEGNTGCPAVHSNFDTPLFSGMAWDIWLIFGVFKVHMKTFFYMYKTWGLVAIWLRKYLGKLEQVLKLSFWRPNKIACQMRQNSMQEVSNDIILSKMKRIIVEFNWATSHGRVLPFPGSK